MNEEQREVAERLVADQSSSNLEWSRQVIALLRELLAEPQGEPVAVVTECEACFTPDVCQLRGKCDHYAASQLRVAKQAHPPQQRKPLSDEQITALVREAAKGSAIRRDGSTSHRIARAIERAITGEPT